jgi:signal peptidase II
MSVAPGMSPRWRLGSFALVLPLVGCDHATKWAAKGALEDQPPRRLLGRVLELRYAENTDIAWNLLRWIPESVRRPALLVLGAAALVALLVATVRAQRPWMRAALVLVTAGAAGNYFDRLVRGYVVDFIHLTHWPVFNVADAYVVAGAGLLALMAWRSKNAGATSPG